MQSQFTVQTILCDCVKSKLKTVNYVISKKPTLSSPLRIFIQFGDKNDLLIFSPNYL